MDIIRFVSEEPKTPFAPYWHWIMAEDFIGDVNFDEISNLILFKEKEIIQNFPPNEYGDGDTGLGSTSLTSRFKSFNVFSWQENEIQKLKEKVIEKYFLMMEILQIQPQKLWMQCWANVLRTNEEIKPHIHGLGPYCYLGGHICVQTENTKTVYINPINQIVNCETYESENVQSKISFFQNNIPHYTTKHISQKERITIAFDLMPEEQYKFLEQNNSSHNLVRFV